MPCCASMKGVLRIEVTIPEACSEFCSMRLSEGVSFGGHSSFDPLISLVSFGARLSDVTDRHYVPPVIGLSMMSSYCYISGHFLLLYYSCYDMY